jgi:hypothetical protein
VKQSLDFIVIGAQKSGTTTLFEYLRKHPELYVPAGKEAPFFSHDSEWNGGWSEYVRRYFARATEAERWGTVTPHYMYGSLYEAAEPEMLAGVRRPERLVPERIASHSPEARLIAILREPVERAYSHFRMERFREAERRTFDTAIDELLDPTQLERSRRQPTEVTSYVTNGEYGRILTPYFELFGKDRILVCFASELAAEPATTFSSILRFLDVASDFQPSNLGQRYRVAGSRRRLRRLDLDRLERRVASSRHLRSAWHALPTGLRERVDRDFKELKYQADVRNRVVERQTAAPLEEVRERLRAHYASDRERLRMLIGCELPW